MAYTKTNWTNTTPINTTNLNNIENGISANDISIGNLSDLTTPATDTLVGAINSIVESGSNENGEYIKFANGTMICKNTQRIVGITTSNSSSSVVPKSAEQTGFTFPIEFIDRPIVLMNACRASAWIGYSWVATTSTTQNYCIYTNVPVSDYYMDIQYVAFGRWK